MRTSPRGAFSRWIDNARRTVFGSRLRALSTALVHNFTPVCAVCLGSVIDRRVNFAWNWRTNLTFSVVSAVPRRSPIEWIELPSERSAVEHLTAVFRT
jgi:hypothetical protein